MVCFLPFLSVFKKTYIILSAIAFCKDKYCGDVDNNKPQAPPLYVFFMFQKCNRLRWATKLTSLGNEAYFICQRSLLRFLMRF